MMKPELVADYLCETGEGAIWHPMENRLYRTDIPTRRMFWFDRATGRHRQFCEGASVGGYTVQKDESLLLFMEKGAVATLQDGKLEFAIEDNPAVTDARFNDVATDPRGRVFCGTTLAPGHPGTLYRLDVNGSNKPVHVWSAGRHGSSLCRYTPAGELERRIWFPARKVSSLTFAGPDLADIYVTTAGGQNKAAEGPGAGDLFRLNQGIRGRSEFLSCVGL